MPRRTSRPTLGQVGHTLRRSRHFHRVAQIIVPERTQVRGQLVDDRNAGRDGDADDFRIAEVIGIRDHGVAAVALRGEQNALGGAHGGSQRVMPVGWKRTTISLSNLASWSSVTFRPAHYRSRCFQGSESQNDTIFTTPIHFLPDVSRPGGLHRYPTIKGRRRRTLLKGKLRYHDKN
jgi:hypothetical protein